MGFSQQPSIDDYFQNDELGIFRSDWIKSHISRDKWYQLHTNIHIEPNQLISKLNENFKNAWNLHQELVIDELIIPFEGRYKHIQNIPSKPHTTGLKIYCLNDKMYYLLWEFWLFEGDDSTKGNTKKELVLDFVSIVEEYYTNGRQFILVADTSYYGTYEFAKELVERKFPFLLSCPANQPSWIFSVIFT
jgi:hypothetical protein